MSVGIIMADVSLSEPRITQNKIDVVLSGSLQCLCAGMHYTDWHKRTVCNQTQNIVSTQMSASPSCRVIDLSAHALTSYL